jgi:hypothetical protein
MEPNGCCSILLFSSLVFITNIVSAFYKKYYIYSLLFCGLTLTSVIYHYNTNMYTNIADRMLVSAVVLYGGYMLYKKSITNNRFNYYFIILTFLSCGFLYIYGYLVDDYCYHPNKFIGDIYHGILHIISSFGHHLIIFL